MGGKIKLLFVVSEFYQAGTERFTYELDRALNKEKFSVSILCIYPLNNSTRFTDHYYEKHKALGSAIYFWQDIDQVRHPTLKERIAFNVFGTPLPHEHENLRFFLDCFDCISVMGEYNYMTIHRWMKPEHKEKCLIHIQNSRHQRPDIYTHFPKNENLHFVSGFSEEEITWELAEFESYRHTYFSLYFKVENTFVKTGNKAVNTPKIGMFTRLTPTKPLDPFIYSFQLLKELIPGAQLHVFGSGDPEQEGVNRYIRQLDLQDSVFFRGHQENLVQTAVEENLDLVWLHGYHGIPGGWAGFDICTTKIPQIFWNFGGTEQTVYTDLFPMYNQISAFAGASAHLLQQPEEAERLAQKQFDYIEENRNIMRFIHIMEELYIRIARPHEV